MENCLRGIERFKNWQFFCVSCFENELIQVSESICRLQMKIIRQFIGVESNSQVQDCTAMSQSVIIL